MKVVVLNILIPYEFEVTIIVERGFKSIDLFKFIDETLNGNIVLDVLKIWEYPLPEKEKLKN